MISFITPSRRSTVEALARRGVSSILTYNSNRAATDEVVAPVGQAGALAVALQLDTSDTGAFPAFADEVRRVLGDWGADQVNFLVNMAGTSHSGLLSDVTEEDFDAAYRVHVKGPLFLTQTLLPLIADGGRIVNISSGLTRIIYPGRIAYGAMKGAVDPLHGQGTRTPPHRRQYGGAGRHPDRLLRRHGARQSGSCPARRRGDRGQAI